MPNNEQQETTYPIYNQYIYKEGIGWVLIGGGGGGGDSLPDQTNNSGKYLTTNGSAASWSAVTPASIGALPTGTTAAQIGAIPDTHVVNGITQADIDDWNSDEIFIAVSGTTTYTDTLAAYNAGKLIVAKTNTGKFVPLTTYNGSELRFEHLNGNQRAWIVLNSSGWGYGQQTAYVQENRTINNKALSSNITLTATDVGAVPDSAAAAGITSEDIANWNSKADTNTDEKLAITNISSGRADGIYYPIIGSDSASATTRQYDTKGLVYEAAYGGKASQMTGKASLTLGNNYNSYTGANKQGILNLYGSTAYKHTIQGAPTADRTLTLPDATGTIALTTDIPSSLNDLTNDPGFIVSPNVAYFTCSTGANAAAKSATLVSGSITSTEVIAGAQILVKFTNSNTASSPTLTLSGITSTASPIKIYGTTAPGTTTDNSWNAGAVIALTYDGTNWIMNDFNNTTYSSMSAEEITAGTGTSDRVITPARLKTAIQTWAMPYNHDASGITSTDIANWDAKVSDDKTWNGVTLDKTGMSSGSTGYIPERSSTTSTTAYQRKINMTPEAASIAVYDNNAYLNSTTPAVHDTSTKVATTDFVATELSYIDGLPTQTNNAGKFLTTNGTTASWTSIDTLLDYKGVKSTAAQLPSSNNVTGDVWLVSEDNSEYIWNGTTWEKFGPTIDLSGYVPTSRKVNNKALSSDITLTATDVGAIPDSAAAAGIEAADITNWNNKSATDEKVKAVSGLSNGSTYYPIYGGSTGNAETKYYHTAFTFKYGANAVAQLGIGKQGSPGTLAIYKGTNNSSNYGLLQASTLTANRTYDLPDATGTLALYSQIPTSLNDLTNDPGFVTDGDLSTTLADYMVKGVDYVTAGKKNGTTLGTKVTAEGMDTTASGDYSHAEGYSTKSSGNSSHAEGWGSEAIGDYSHAEGVTSLTRGRATHAEGFCTISIGGDASHAEGCYTVAIAPASHAEGYGMRYELKLTGNGNSLTYSNSTNVYIPYGIVANQLRIYESTYTKKWYNVTAITTNANILTSITLDETLSSNTITNYTCYLYLPGAIHSYSHVEGAGTISGSNSQHVGGQYNVQTNGAEIIGGGTDNAHRTNIRTLDWSGNETLAGKLTLGTGPSAAMDAATKEYVDTKATITIVDWTAA